MYDFHFLKNKVGRILEFRVWTRFGNRIFINVHFEKMSGRILILGGSPLVEHLLSDVMPHLSTNFN